MAMPFFIHQFAGLPYPPSDATKAQTDAFNIPAWRQSLIVSILSAGTFFGALAAGDIADFIGRRLTIIAGCAIFTLGVVLQVSALCPRKVFLGRCMRIFSHQPRSCLTILGRILTPVDCLN
jgi:SP family sugar:H+ symporter-like MFS transporter